MEPISLAIIIAATALLAGGGSHVVTKGKFQQRVVALQNQLREVQERLGQAQARLVEFQRVVAELQNSLVERQNRIAELQERELNLQLVIDDIAHRVQANSSWWRRTMARLMLRHQALLKETEELRARWASSEQARTTTQESRERAQVEVQRLRSRQSDVSTELNAIELLCEQTLSERNDVDQQLAGLLR